MKTYTIGRNEKSDVPIDGPTVSRKHAELTITRDGKYYLIDCSSSFGTFIAGLEEWEQVTQSFVNIGDTVLFGRHQVSMGEVINSIETGNAMKLDVKNEVPENDLPSGEVMRDPETGEPVKR